MLYFPIWKRVLILGLCLLGILFALPNLFYERADEAARARAEIARLEKAGKPVPPELRAKAEEWPSWLPGNVVNLGLDLRGGVHLLVEVQVGEVIAERMQQLRADVRRALIDGGVRRFTNLAATPDHVSVTITDPADVERAERILRDMARPVSGILSLGAGAGAADLVVERTDDRTFRITLSEAAVAELTDRTMAQSLEIIRRRIDEAGTREPTIQRQGRDRILIQVPGLGSAEELLGLIGRTAKLTFHEVVGPAQPGQVAGPDEMVLPDREGNYYLLKRRPVLTGEHLVDAQPGFHPQNGLPIVNFRFDTTGARIFGEYTAANVGRLFAIVLDNEVISAPRIQSPILGGAGYIEGSFTVESATELAILLRSGALPASIKVLEQRTVGPDLGADSIEKGKVATVLALLGVVVFMAVYYGLFGLFADIALLMNIVLVFALLSAIGATLTLPGIAGIVLTIGMAVDANVLIFERIREELRNAGGRGISRAVERGYEQALSAILDANITTLIAAVILFGMGSGPVRGFAVTLGLGIVTSVFTAVMLTRMVVAGWLAWKRPKSLRVGRLSIVPADLRVDFMRWRRLFITGSAVAAALAVVLVGVLGMNFGIDFRGGTMVEIRTPGPADLGQIRSIVGRMNLGDVAVQSFGAENEVLIRVEQRAAEGDDLMGIANAIGEALAKEIPGVTVQRVEVVGPKVSGELLEAGVLAVLLSLAAIAFYIWLRFEWQFGAGAVLALAHDVVLTLGVFAITQIEFNLSIVAALLTIVGYSLNDTVVVFDRVRENLRRYKKMPLDELLSLTISETMSRTLMTSLTTLIALVAMFVLGPEVIKGFTFAMIWGILVGTYSSIFIASPLLLWLGVKRDWSKEENKAGVQFGGAQV